MDQIDTKILQQLQRNAKIPMKELATIVHLSSPAVIERVKKLEEQSIIEGYTTKVNLKKINGSMQAIILFKSIDCKSLANFCMPIPMSLNVTAWQVKLVISSKSLHTQWKH